MSEEPEKQATNQGGETKFKPGVSGNPGGRPNGAVSLTTALKRKLRERPDLADQLLESYILQALQGNSSLAKEIWERVDGKVAQVNVNAEAERSSFTDAALRQVLAQATQGELMHGPQSLALPEATDDELDT